MPTGVLGYRQCFSGIELNSKVKIKVVFERENEGLETLIAQLLTAMLPYADNVTVGEQAPQYVGIFRSGRILKIVDLVSYGRKSLVCIEERAASLISAEPHPDIGSERRRQRCESDSRPSSTNSERPSSSRRTTSAAWFDLFKTTPRCRLGRTLERSPTESSHNNKKLPIARA